jgi:sugar/nucleoside kinase (ribokinase family)
MSRYASWGIIVDDIVFPDGRTAMGVLGGGGLYAAAGMRLWTPDVQVQAGVGLDFNPKILETSGLDGSGLEVTGLPTPRAWQLFEENGRRTQIYRISDEVAYQQLVLHPSAAKLPPTIEAVHILLRGHPREEQLVEALHKAGIRIGAEPVIGGRVTEDEHASLLRCISLFDIFSPSESEAVALVGQRPVKEQLRTLAELGPNIVALRQGADGSIIYERETGQYWQIPAASADVVDVTGAGNAYCGGLLAGWIELGDVKRAAAQAAVSAAIAIEQVGPPPIDEAVMTLANRRAERMMERIQPLELTT